MGSKKKNVTTLKMEIFSAYEHEIPILSSYTERKEEVKGKSPWSQLRFIKASQNICILKPVSDAHNNVPGSDHFKAIKLTLLHSS